MNLHNIPLKVHFVQTLCILANVRATFDEFLETQFLTLEVAVTLSSLKCHVIHSCAMISKCQAGKSRASIVKNPIRHNADIAIFMGGILDTKKF